MIFNDRKHAGEILAELLSKYRGRSDVIVIGLPRGGVVLANEVRKKLKVPLDIIVARKIGAPMNKEYAIGAITEEGYGVFNKEETRNISKDYLIKETEKEKKEAERRTELYRMGIEALDLKQKIVIIVDDGIATGMTMKAAIAKAKRLGAKKIVIGAAAASSYTVKELESEVDEIVVINNTPLFRAVGQFYKNFEQTDDEEVLEIMREQSKSTSQSG